MKKQGRVFVVSAPSGCGKTTIVNRVLAETDGVVRSISATTREPRQGEKRGRDYYFISEKSFRKKVEKGLFLEWANNFGYHYGTPKSAVLKPVNQGLDAILTIDVKGAAQVKRKIRGCVMVFISPPGMGELAERLKKRASDADKEMRARLETAKREMAQAKKYDYIIVNDKLNEAVQELKAIIIAARCENRKGK